MLSSRLLMPWNGEAQVTCASHGPRRLLAILECTTAGGREAQHLAVSVEVLAAESTEGM